MIEIDNTARTCFDACEQKYFLRHVLHLVPIEPASMAPYFGASLHKGFQAHYEGKTRDECMKAFGEEYAKWFDEKDDERTPANGMVILDEFIRRMKEDFLETVKLEIGHVSLIERDGMEVMYKMRIDRIANWKGEIALEDWKTSRYIGSSFTIIKPNNQFVGYARGVRELMGENPWFFLTMVGTHVKKRVKEGEEKIEISRDSVRFTEADFEEFEKGVISTAEKIMKCEEENYWPKRTHSCPSFSGCEYIPLCKAEGDVWRGMIETFYRKEEWKAYEG